MTILVAHSVRRYWIAATIGENAQRAAKILFEKAGECRKIGAQGPDGIYRGRLSVVLP
jgi:hypothetical protein